MIKRVVLYQRIPGHLSLEEKLIKIEADKLQIPIEYASEKMIERRRIKLDASTLVSGSIRFMLNAFRVMKIDPPEHIPYPKSLIPWLGRKVSKEEHLSTVLYRLENYCEPIFIKPAKGWKRFTGFVATSPHDHRFQGASRRDPVWTSDPVVFLSEWRVYVANGVILDIKFANGEDRTKTPDVDVIKNAITTLHNAGEAWAGFAIDFGVTDKGETLLVEENDGFSIGAYDDLASEKYWEMVVARWFQLVSQANH